MKTTSRYLNKIIAINSLLLILFVSSCKKEQTLIKHATDPTKINLTESSKKDELVDYIKNFKILKLFTNIKLANIDKVKFFNNMYYVLDKKTSNLVVFNEAGVFINKIGERGRGPGEYIKITDFEIDSKRNQILLLSEPNRAFFKYSLKGDFIKRISLDFFVHGFVLTKNDNLVFMSGRSSKTKMTLTRTDLNGKVIQYDVPFPEDIKIKSFGYTGGIHKQGISNYFTEATSSLVYEVEDYLTPKYQFNFGEDTWKEEDRYNLDKFVKERKQHNISHLINFYCDNNEVLAFRFKKGKYYRKGYYFKNSHKFIASPYNLKDSFLYSLLSHEIGIKTESFISALNYPLYEFLINSKEAQLFKDSNPEFYQYINDNLKGFSENDNPYLLIYEVKDIK
ncbi:6-bladed beta-propeller [Seonamhaeicola sediminis]|uniref:6-bladed beta-propeller n=1 Tax=Seonamhaeicola sediminis TaxID=2528206 RepID=A0A562YAP0_9FLAO|nr:6-bladed beta-propeller [Seonamhaeicola sediminis]TWO31570.1 6-bladed beta-propeller [Seonamhaeicola sediminis]